MGVCRARPQLSPNRKVCPSEKIFHARAVVYYHFDEETEAALRAERARRHVSSVWLLVESLAFTGQVFPCLASVPT